MAHTGKKKNATVGVRIGDNGDSREQAIVPDGIQDRATQSEGKSRSLIQSDMSSEVQSIERCLRCRALTARIVPYPSVYASRTAMIDAWASRFISCTEISQVKWIKFGTEIHDYFRRSHWFRLQDAV